MNEALPPGEFTKALQKRKAANRRRKYRLIGGLGGLVVMVALSVYLLLFSSAFAVREVVVTGTERLSEQEVIVMAQVDVGVPLLRQDTAAIEARVQELASVRSARAHLRWPSRVEVEVTERQAAFQMAAATGGYDLVDDEAVVFFRSPEPVPGVPVAAIEGGDERLLRDVATVARAVPAQLRDSVVSLSAESVDRIAIALSESRTVIWGSAEESDLKANVLTVLLQVDANVYDVSAPQNPTTR